MLCNLFSRSWQNMLLLLNLFRKQYCKTLLQYFVQGIVFLDAILKKKYCYIYCNTEKSTAILQY